MRDSRHHQTSIHGIEIISDETVLSFIDIHRRWIDAERASIAQREAYLAAEVVRVNELKRALYARGWRG